MPVPLPIALPVAAGGLAYLNARTSGWYDLHLVGSILPTIASAFWRMKITDRLSAFYLLEALATSKSSANRHFLLFEGKAYTYAQTYEYALRYGNWLATRWGVKKDDIVALDFQNTDTLLFLWMGLWAIGARPALINYNLTGAALVHCLKKATARLVFVDPVVAANTDDGVRRSVPDVHFEVFGPELEAEALSAEPVRHPDEARSGFALDTMAILIYTSGTTGMPKAAVISWGKIAVVGGFSRRFIGTKPSDIYYTSMPLYHSTATLMALCNVIFTGATLALARKFSAQRFWVDVRTYDATIVQYVGETCRYLLAAPPTVDAETGQNLDRAHRVRVAFGNGLRPDVWGRFRERFGIDTIAEFYGATEGSFATWNLSRNDLSLGAVGRSGWLYRLAMRRPVALVAVDPVEATPARDPATGFCRRVRAGEPGEMMFELNPERIEARFQGYYGDKTASEKKVMRNVFRKGDAWFRTGDIMRRDRSGEFMYFCDRLGDTFRWKSENVSTAEVAQVVGLHPAVRDVNVYGVEVPGHEGRAGCAALVLDPVAVGVESSKPKPSGAVLKSLAEHVEKGLPKYAVPLFLRLQRETGLQTTGTNKKQKHRLREEGVQPTTVGDDQLFWYRSGTYEPFGDPEWGQLKGSRVRL